MNKPFTDLFLIKTFKPQNTHKIFDILIIFFFILTLSLIFHPSFTLFMNTEFSIVEVIQLMLAPGVMISACGLLLLGMNNKYSLVVGRTRLLTEERRRLFKRAGERELEYDDSLRLESISVQLKRLVFRVRLVRNAVLCYTGAVALFVLTSLFIGAQFIAGFNVFNYTITIFFLLGMISVLGGIIFAAIETKRGFEIIQYEVKIDE